MREELEPQHLTQSVHTLVCAPAPRELHLLHGRCVAAVHGACTHTCLDELALDSAHVRVPGADHTVRVTVTEPTTGGAAPTHAADVQLQAMVPGA